MKSFTAAGGDLPNSPTADVLWVFHAAVVGYGGTLVTTGCGPQRRELPGADIQRDMYLQDGGNPAR